MSKEILVHSPTFDQHPTGFGIGNSKPRLSWRFTSSDDTPRGWYQDAYELEIEAHGVNKAYRVDSTNSVMVPWPSKPLLSRDRALVRVRCFGHAMLPTAEDESTPTEWSDWATVEAALLDQHDWTAQMITGPSKIQLDGPIRPLRFRRRFEIPTKNGKIAYARLYVTAQGVYQAYINGYQIGDQHMAPGFTSYHHRLHYQVFDVTEMLQAREQNVIAAEVGEGWFAGRLWREGGQLWGRELGFIAQLEIRFHGHDYPVTILSDESWEWNTGPMVTSEIYNGEVYDMQQKQPGWNRISEHPQRDGWRTVRTLPFHKVQLIAPEGPPVRVIEEMPPLKIFKATSGATLIDFGQNLVGKLRIYSLQKPRGHQVSFHHAEVLENGELGTRPLRTATCTDTIICSGEELVNWSPSFTFHGFRYVQVDGWADVQASDITALVMHSDMRRTGHFSCSEEKVNQLHKNALWSMRGNFFSIPTDCPQRDERLGWTGDIQVFCPSANFLYHTAGILSDWLGDLAVEQAEDSGVPPMIVPNVQFKKTPRPPQAVWGDAAILVPWALYRSFEDTALLERQYYSMKSWLAQGVARGPDGLWTTSLWQHGDWLDPAAPAADPGNGQTDGVYVADAYIVYVTNIMSQIASALRYSDDAEEYHQSYLHLKRVFEQKYISPSGLVVCDTQTALSLAIVFSLFSNPDQIQNAGERLARKVRFAKFHVATGFAGTPLITHALTMVGSAQLAYRMLLEETCPSWLYPVTMGATTMWERWDSMLPNGTINPGSMTSFNHYALGSIVNWLHSCVGGISPEEPGWRKFKVRPVPGGTVTSAEVRYDSQYGLIKCSWRVENEGAFKMTVLIPPHSSAWVIMPDQQRAYGEVEEGVLLGSGKYELSCPWTCKEWPPQPLMTLFKPPEDAASK